MCMSTYSTRSKRTATRSGVPVNMLSQHAFRAIFCVLATLLIMVGAKGAPNGRFNAAYMSLTSVRGGPLARRRDATSLSGPCGHGCCIRHGGSKTVTRATLEDTLLEAASDPEIVGAVTQEQLVVGFVAGVFPFVWAAYEFWKRIDTQQRCGVCQGSGLVSISKTGKELKVQRKCYACGGFIPWLGWRAFWLSNLDIGNGGVLQRPAADYEELSQAARDARRTVEKKDR